MHHDNTDNNTMIYNITMNLKNIDKTLRLKLIQIIKL